MASSPSPPSSSAAAAVPPPSAADIAPSASPLPPSKRRWTPCTWRYAIEDAQPELSSRSRPSTPSPSPPPSSFPLRSRPPHIHPLPLSVQTHHRDRPRRVHGSRLGLVGYPRSDKRFKDKASEQLPVRRDKNHHDQLHPSKEESEPSTADGEEEEEEEGSEEGRGRGRRHSDASTDRVDNHGVQNLKRRKREMSPSELYFCKICAAAGEAATVAASMGTDACLQDS